MRSHLPDPIIIHLEKRSLGLSETQIIPGKGQENVLQNAEPDLAHHLTFQARYEQSESLRSLAEKSPRTLFVCMDAYVFI